MEIVYRKERNIGPDREKRKEHIVSREYSCNGKVLLKNKTFSGSKAAIEEVLKAFEEIGAYI